MKKVKESAGKVRKMRPALTPESRESQLISLATDLAEKELMEGTASSQVITHFLKLGSSKELLEKERLKHENELLKAKTESIKAEQRSDVLFEKAIAAMKRYSGYDGKDYSDEEPDDH